MFIRAFLLVISVFLFASSPAQTTIDRESDLVVFNQALNLFENKNYGAARDRFEKFIQLNPTEEMMADARYYQAYCAMELFNEDAEYLLENFVAEYPTNAKSGMAFFELGNFYYRNKQYKKAITAFEKVKAQHISIGQRNELKFKMGYSYFNLKDKDNALSNFTYSLQSENVYQGASGYYAGFIALENGDYNNALKYLEIAEKKDAYKNVVPFMITKIYYGQENYTQVISYAQPLLQSESSLKNRTEIELLVADAYYNQKDYRNAYRFFGSALSRSKNNQGAPVFFRAGFTAYISGYFEEAVSLLKNAALSEDALGQSASYYLGLSYIRLDNKQFAISAFENASKKDFDKKIQNESMYYLGKLNFEMNRYSETIQVLSNYKNSQLTNSDHLKEVDELISESYLLTDDVNAALEYIESLSTKSEKVKQVYQFVTYKKAIALFNAEKYYEAVQMFKLSLENPYDRETVLESYYWMGEAFSIGKRFEEARSEYLNVLREDPSNAFPTSIKTRYGLGYCFFNLKEYGQALTHFKFFVDRNPSKSSDFFYDDALLRLADCYYATKDYSSAIGVYNRAMKARNQDTDYCLYQIGLISGITGDLTTAQDNLNNLIRNYKNSVYFDDAMFQMGQLAFENGGYADAIQRFSLLISEQPNSPFVPYAYVNRAISYYNLKELDKSIKDYVIVIEEFPRHPIANSALLGLQETLTLTNRAEEFATYLDSYKKSNPDDKDLLNVEFDASKALYFNQKYEEAIGAFNQYLKNYPDNPFRDEVYYYLGESYYRSNDFEEAIRNFISVTKMPASKWINRSTNRVGMLSLLTQNYDQAIVYYKKLESIANNRREENDAWEGLMESYLHILAFDSTIFYANKILEKGALNANTQNKAQLMLGKAYLGKGDGNKALDYLISTVNTAKDAYGAEAQYLIAEVFRSQGEFQRSNEALFNLNENFGIYEEWIGKSFLMIADNYIDTDEMFQAKATLSSLIENSPIEYIVSLAREKLLQIEMVEKEILAEDTVD